MFIYFLHTVTVLYLRFSLWLVWVGLCVGVCVCVRACVCMCKGTDENRPLVDTTWEVATDNLDLANLHVGGERDRKAGLSQGYSAGEPTDCTSLSQLRGRLKTPLLGVPFASLVLRSHPTTTTTTWVTAPLDP